MRRPTTKLANAALLQQGLHHTRIGQSTRHENITGRSRLNHFLMDFMDQMICLRTCCEARATCSIE